MKIKAGIDPIESPNFIEDLFYGGYINPEELLEEAEDIEKVNQAVEIIQQFQDSLRERGILVDI